MEYNILGRTGLKTSVIGLGAGGYSRLGLSSGKSEAEAAHLVASAFERGINLFDTAEEYGTEVTIGIGLKPVIRSQVILSTKFSLYDRHERLKAPEQLEMSLDGSLARLQTDYVDIYHLHRVLPEDYEYARQYLVPKLIEMKEKGKIRFIGITERFPSDPGHAMLAKAVQDRCFDVMMVGFNIMNQSARDKLFGATRAGNIGVLNMFAVRRALADQDTLAEIVDDLFSKGLLCNEQIDRKHPLNFLLHKDGADSITDAAYRYCRHEPGIHSILMGTGNMGHLEENIRSALKSKLPDRDLHKIKQYFADLDCFTGN